MQRKYHLFNSLIIKNVRIYKFSYKNLSDLLIVFTFATVNGLTQVFLK